MQEPTSTKSDPLILKITWSLLLMGICLEWLQPLQAMTGRVMTGGEQTWLKACWILLTVLLLAIGFLPVPAKTGAMLRVAILTAALYVMTGSGSPAAWLHDQGQALWSDLLSWLAADPHMRFSSQTRLLVMLTGWGLMVASVQRLMLYRLTLFLFTGATVAYLLLLEALSGPDMFWPVGRVVLWGILLQGILRRNILWLAADSADPSYEDRASFVRWSAGTAVSAVLLLLLGTAAVGILPHQSAGNLSLERVWSRVSSWTDLDFEPSQPAAVTGYGSEDTPLGAPLMQEDRPLFEAVSPLPAYWRGEYRSWYDGRQWNSQGENYQTIQPGSAIPEDTAIMDSRLWHTVSQTITFHRQPLPHEPLFIGGVPVSMQWLPASQKNPEIPSPEKTGQAGTSGEQSVNPALEQNLSSGLVRLGDELLPPDIRSYRMDVLVPDRSAERLRHAAGDDPPSILAKYTQLPASLPGRIGELGHRIMQGAGSRYDAVQATVSYLDEHYSYTLNTEQPPTGRDFVDDFLFVSKKGYCNHFSTALVVLLRSQGIPARWAKGFAPGTPDPQQPGHYQVTTADAHSWAEVYFPGVGWLPFEATPGFAAATQAQPALSGAVAGQAASKPLQPRAGAAWAAAPLHMLRQLGTAAAERPLQAAAAMAGLLLAAAAGAYAWRLRTAMQLGLLLAWPRSRFPDRERLLRAAVTVWAALARRCGARAPGQTPREYAAVLAARRPEHAGDISRFAEAWERLAYAPEHPGRMETQAFLRLCLRLASRLF
ncbi:transglutaminase domain-containing protein [Paenibacillus sp. JX-17]|uniref:Transglutaminase domain-containing protein n=1 Tax=Paenibacillus lacisoli TaxID=3064525 RepID=A0ABT9CKT0_9BACL|nr:transglutaminase domain-containing protein [Paenibacillus sp. JX-17]MDO7908233.1 transglutaminase domain-containing protein [Paenibacillus sp. JX-17]